MFKFKIVYYVEENNGNSERDVTVFAETVQGAEEKIKAMDPTYIEIAALKAKEYPHWNPKGGNRE